MRTVQIVGVSPGTALPDTDGERWGFNNPRSYRVRCPQMLGSWTRWFNLHSERHMRVTYPDGFAWCGRQTKPVILQASFPAAEMVRAFGTRYFVCSLAWLIAFAIYSGFERIEVWGYSGDREYAVQRPCLAYWVQRARESGVDIAGLENLGEPGDAVAYDGPLYGFETS